MSSILCLTMSWSRLPMYSRPGGIPVTDWGASIHWRPAIIINKGQSRKRFSTKSANDLLNPKTMVLIKMSDLNVAWCFPSLQISYVPKNWSPPSLLYTPHLPVAILVWNYGTSETPFIGHRSVQGVMSLLFTIKFIFTRQWFVNHPINSCSFQNT